MDSTTQQQLLHFPLVSSDEEACLYAMQLTTFCALPITVKAAIELDLFEIVAEAGPGAYLSPAEIAARLPKQNPGGLDRMLRLLASYNVLTCSVGTAADGRVERKYGAAPVVKFFVKNEDGVSTSPLALLSNDKTLLARWQYMKDSVMNGGIAFNKAFGMTTFEFIGKDPRLNNLFNESMVSSSSIYMKGILEAYKGFDDVEVLVDVGGGVGGILNMIVTKHPHIKGINYDQAHVTSEAQAISGVEHVSGNMFESVPSGDAMFIKSVLHNWSDEHCVKLLKNCWRALPKNGKVIVMECCLPTYPESTTGAQTVFHFDVVMMSMHPGKERTKEEFAALAKEAGFSRTNFPCSYAIYWMIEFIK